MKPHLIFYANKSVNLANVKNDCLNLLATLKADAVLLESFEEAETYRSLNLAHYVIVTEKTPPASPISNVHYYAIEISLSGILENLTIQHNIRTLLCPLHTNLAARLLQQGAGGDLYVFIHAILHETSENLPYPKAYWNREIVPTLMDIQKKNEVVIAHYNISQEVHAS